MITLSPQRKWTLEAGNHKNVHYSGQHPHNKQVYPISLISITV